MTIPPGVVSDMNVYGVPVLEFEESNVGVFLRIQTLLATSIKLRTYLELVPVDVLSYV